MATPSTFAEQVLSRVRMLVGPFLEARHVELVELTYRREGPHTVLRFLVETAAGITIAQCGELNRAVGALLDEHDVIPDHYTLEVASPGLDRPLKTGRDFERVIGRRVRIQTSEAVEGLWEILGTVASVGDELVTIERDQGDRIRVLLRAVTSARQEITFS